MDEINERFHQLVLNIHKSDFQSTDALIDAFYREYPEAAKDIELIRKITLHQAVSYWKNGELQRSLDLYMTLWNQYSTDHRNYASVSLCIIQILADLERFEVASKFVEDAFLSQPDQILKTFHPTVLVHVLPLYLPTSADYFEKIKASIIHIEGGINIPISIDRDNPVKGLQQIAFKMREEGITLTKIHAYADTEDKDITIKKLAIFIQSATTKLYIEQAQNLISHLKKKKI
ncbi:hypothetical protein L0657_08455 [Dyadobacter sp. CY345]|uniref:hypothetical protein n=1 Tax=Dyadobacter sp. CY345 TaxID=2909335 RepID=UPI001F2B4EBD|nr:hypothetical protein [Dyadobacter sp. CY345]MCF2443983.1 hypothetical protein [Dyadobacter sp. CY345]